MSGHTIKPRRLLDDDQPDGYLESDNDWIANNHEAVIQFLESADSHAELVKALEFYADCNRYDGPNQRLIGDDPYTPKDQGYRQDITRDGGAIARAALATLTARKVG